VPTTRIAIIAALPAELKPFLDANAKEGWVHERRGNVHLWRLTWPDQAEWIAACAGAGQAAATRAFAEIEKDGPIDRVVSTGWAGALNTDFLPGRAYPLSGVIDTRTGERFRSTGDQCECWLATSDRVADEKEKLRLAVTYAASLVDMEAAAIARLAAMRGIPFYCIKGVSDGFHDRLPDFNPFLGSDGQFRIGRFIFYALIRPWHWPALARMGENSKKAAEAIAVSVLDILYQLPTSRKGHGDTDHQH
jgi:adenosylhomocysteine nucleosidase